MPEYRGSFRITRKNGVLDPEGVTIFEAMKRLGYSNVEDVHTGRLFEIRLRATNKDEALKTFEELGRRVLSNPVIENAELTDIEEL